MDTLPHLAMDLARWGGGTLHEGGADVADVADGGGQVGAERAQLEEQEGGRWISIKEAAEALHISEDAVRRRLKKGILEGEQEERPQGFVWRVKLPANLDRANATNLVSWFDSKAPARPVASPKVQTTSGDAPDTAVVSVTLPTSPQTNVDEQIEAARLQERVVGLERELAAANAERDRWHTAFENEQRELQAAREEREKAEREFRVILAQQAQALNQALPASVDSDDEVPETRSEATAAATSPEMAPSPRDEPESALQSWWRRLLGGT